ncbi:MAG TPA: hypothetical protein VK195_01440, partial [Burkholderiaceae bacterium]|nr:hypothetical protein [Burkholderiaceae bacterium]
VVHAGEPAVRLAAVLQDLKDTSGPEAHAQIAAAVEASAQLRGRMEDLLSRGRFKGFVVLPKAQLIAGKGGRFGGYVDDSKIVLSSEFLTQLKRSRYFDVVESDDVPPNNTTFALAHLLHHLEHPKPAPLGMPILAFLQASMQQEASAFIVGWNAMLEAAETSNGGRPLNSRQQAQLLLNTRYAFALHLGMQNKAQELKFDERGAIELNEANITAIATPLPKAPMADIE